MPLVKRQQQLRHWLCCEGVNHDVIILQGQKPLGFGSCNLDVDSQIVQIRGHPEGDVVAPRSVSLHPSDVLIPGGGMVKHPIKKRLIPIADLGVSQSRCYRRADHVVFILVAVEEVVGEGTKQTITVPRHLVHTRCHTRVRRVVRVSPRSRSRSRSSPGPGPNPGEAASERVVVRTRSGGSLCMRDQAEALTPQVIA